MPLFYFDVIEVDGRVTEDMVGVELPSVVDAKKQADIALAELTAEEIMKGDNFRIRIRTRELNGDVVDFRQSEVSGRLFK